MGRVVRHGRGPPRAPAVNRDGGKLPPPAEVDKVERLHARSITLSSDRLGQIARMDLIEADGGKVTPVDYKRGKRPHIERGAYDPERVQLCVQGLLLREHGYACDEGVLYFVGSREPVRVVFDDDLVAATRQAVEGLRGVAAEGVIPPPLEDSPKCPRCSLVEVCLPATISRGPTSLRGRSPCPAPRRCLCTCRPAAPRSRLKPDRLDHRQTGRVRLPRGIPAASLKHVVQKAAPGQADRVFRGGIPAASLEHGRLCARRSRRRCWPSGSRCRAWPRRWPTTAAVTRPQIVPDPGETCPWAKRASTKHADGW